MGRCNHLLGDYHNNIVKFDSALFLINDLPSWGIKTPFDGTQGKVKREKVTIECLEYYVHPVIKERKIKAVAALKRRGWVSTDTKGLSGVLVGC